MKKILLSLATIGVVGAIVAGATSAYFSDTEISTGNTFTAGTIAISLADNASWSTGYQMPNLMPGESGNVNLKVTNTGTNPESLTKKLYDFVQTGTVDEYKIQDKVLYTLAVEVYKADNTKIWWQTIYSGVKLTDVYDGTKSVDLGTLPVGGYMLINQNYKLDEITGNEYQNHGFTFKMEVVGNQTGGMGGYDSVVLENKGGAPEWAINSSDLIKGTLNYKTTGPKFAYNFSAKVNTPSKEYSLVYVGPSGNFPYSGEVVLGTATADSSGAISLSGEVVTGTITSGKVWLVPTPIGTWDHANNLYETALVNYTQN